MKTIKQTFEAALAARGETLVDTGKTDKWTRKFLGVRSVSGQLIECNTANTFWFLGNAGALRMGSKRTSSIPAGNLTRAVLLAEGASKIK